MGQRISSFLVVLMLMFSGEIIGQNIKAFGLKANYMAIKKQPGFFEPGFSSKHFLGYKECTPSRQKFVLINPVSPSLYTNNLGLICKTELKLDKITPLPFRFRLGSLEYVNWLEQKPNAVKPR